MSKRPVLPNFGLVPGLAFACVLILTALVNPYFIWHQSWGFRVYSVRNLPRPEVPFGPLILRIDEGPRYYLNSRVVPARDLPRVLQETLVYRFQKVVFLQADPNLGYADVIFAVDAIQGAGAKTVLVTSGPRPN